MAHQGSEIAQLYHLVEASNVPSILAYGLLNVMRLLDLGTVAAADRRTFLRTSSVNLVIKTRNV